MNLKFLEQARLYKNELILHLFHQPASLLNPTTDSSFLYAIPHGSNIVGMGLGAKITQGNIIGEEPVLRVYVREKRLEAELSAKLKIPKNINGIPTDVVEVGEVHPYSIPCGVSVSHQNGKPGTIGCLVGKNDGSSDADFLLSNNHIFANFNTARPGDLIVQPAIGSSSNSSAIAKLTDFQVMNFSGGSNFMDAAIAEVINPGSVTPMIKEIGNINRNPIGSSINQSVKKHGRTTGLTHGTVRAIGVDMSIPYLNRNALLIDQIEIQSNDNDRNFSEVGDSGSLIVDNSPTPRPVALLVGGSTKNTGFTVATPIDRILTRFNIVLR